MLFGAFLLYDTQRVIRKAELTPYDGARSPFNNAYLANFDPVNAYVIAVP